MEKTTLKCFSNLNNHSCHHHPDRHDVQLKGIRKIAPMLALVTFMIICQLTCMQWKTGLEISIAAHINNVFTRLKSEVFEEELCGMPTFAAHTKLGNAQQSSSTFPLSTAWLSWWNHPKFSPIHSPNYHNRGGLNQLATTIALQPVRNDQVYNSALSKYCWRFGFIHVCVAAEGNQSLSKLAVSGCKSGRTVVMGECELSDHRHWIQVVRLATGPTLWVVYERNSVILPIF